MMAVAIRITAHLRIQTPRHGKGAEVVKGWTRGSSAQLRTVARVTREQSTCRSQFAHISIPYMARP